MRIAYFDCFSGASGDMILGALLDAGLALDDLQRDLAGLGVEGFALRAEPLRKQGFAATKFHVDVDPAVHKPHRHLKHIREIIERAALPTSVSQRAMSIFTRLAEAEAAVHGTSIEKVHFHEVGAIDAIVDIVGASIAIERLGIEGVYCSAIPTGNGTVRCEHGLMPVPAPATAMLLKGVPIAESAEMAELTTPTGAAILRTLAVRFGSLPGMSIERIGIGAGQRDGATRPNVLRVLIGELIEAPSGEETDEIIVLETCLDDVSGQVMGYVQERLFEAGAFDVYMTAIQMKKNRPGIQLTVLAPPAIREAMETILLRETPTFGIRVSRAERCKLARTIETVETPLGPIRVKVGRRAGQTLTVTPEYEDCRAVAVSTKTSLVEVMRIARKAWDARQD